MPLTAGTRIGPYQVICLVGSGGMGEVYRARDTTLNRDVALKVLPETLAGDQDRLKLFRREAQVLASLNHTNIAHIHGFQDSGGVHALVMELVEGPTLADRLATGPIPVTEVMAIARQIAEALEAAHEQNVVHRDLKPANIKVRDDGTVKILDFGIAKALESPFQTAEDPLNSPAFMTTLTLPGALLGTAAYMSPEQARGKVVDRRTDIWSFGALVYEMVTGVRLFGGDGISETLSAVLTRPVDWSVLPPDTPVALRRLLARCLDRDLKTRLRDIGEARIEIARMATAAVTPVVGAFAWDADAVHARSRPKRLPWIIAGASVTAFMGALLLWAPWRPAVTPQPVRFAVVPPAALPLSLQNVDPGVAISPDGTLIAYMADTSEANLVVRPIGQLDADSVPGVSTASAPFFSPDGKWIGFFAGKAELRKVPLSGGPDVPLGRFAGARGGSWGPNGTIYISGPAIGAGLFAVPQAGGNPAMITKPDLSVGELGHQYPFALPGGEGVLFTITDEDVAKNQIAVLDLKTGQTKRLFRGGSAATYVEPGVLVYAASGALRAVRFDLKRLTTIGDSVPLGETVSMMSTGASQYGLSANGTLVDLPGDQTTRNVARTLVWVDRQGREAPIAGVPVRSYNAVKISPDGSRLALDLRDQAQDIWTWDLKRAKLERFTVGPGLNAFPVWTPDGRRIVFGGLQGGLVQNLFWQPTDGSGPPTRLTTSSGSQSASTISPDGTKVLMREVNAETGADIVMLSLATGKSEPLLQTHYGEAQPVISPDGRMVAYEWTETGRSQIYVATFPDVTAGRWQVTDASIGSGKKPVWSRDGRELFFVSDGALYALPVRTSPTFSSDTPAQLFKIRDLPGLGGGSFYDVSPDGRRFMVIKDAPLADNDPARPKLIVVVNWIEQVKAKLGIK